MQKLLFWLACLNPDITHMINFMAYEKNKTESFRTRNNNFN